MIGTTVPVTAFAAENTAASSEASQTSDSEKTPADLESDANAGISCPSGWDSNDPGWQRAYLKQGEALTQETGNALTDGSMSSMSSYTATKWNGKSYYHDAGDMSDSSVLPVIDVSKWDKNINWTKVARSGVKGTIIRAAYRGSSDGSLHVDPYFISNVKNAKKAGLKVGVYIFSQAVNQTEAKQEANYILNLLDKEGKNGYKIDLPVVIDVEFVSGGRLARAGLSRSAKAKIANKFCDVVKDAGYEPMVYASSAFLVDNMDGNAIADKGNSIWMARYYNYAYRSSGSSGSLFKNRDAVDYWQCSSTSRVSGINTYVDLNWWYKPNDWKSSNVGIKTNGVANVEGLGKASATDSSVTLKWKKAKNVSGYRLYYSTARNGKYKSVDLSSSKTSYTFGNLEKKTGYYYKIRAYKTKSGKKTFGKTSKIFTAVTKRGKTQTFTVQYKKLKIYKHAGESYASTAYLQKKDKVTLNYWTQDKNGRKWAKVTYKPSNTSGYVKASGLK